MCRDYALEYVSIQREQFQRLGVRAAGKILTDPCSQFRSPQITVFGEMASRGYIYKGLRPVYWCPRCEPPWPRPRWSTLITGRFNLREISGGR